jgi:phytoene synthase
MAPESAALTAQFLKEHDKERYYASLVVPAEFRPSIQALCAFSADVASVRDKVSAPAPGEIRLQWWDDALTGQGHGAVRANPVADALLEAMAQYNLPSVPLRRLIAARRFDLYDDPMPDLDTFEGYAGETVSVLYQFAAMILNKGVVVEDGDAAGHLGVAHALIGHLRAFGSNASRGRIFLPLSLLAAHGVTEQQIFTGTDGEPIRAAAAQLRDLARDHLSRAETAITALPKHLRSAFAMLTVLKAQLKLLEKSAENPFLAQAELPDWRIIALLGLWSWRNA